MKVACRLEVAADKAVKHTKHKVFNDLSAAIAAGLGFGGMHTVMTYGSLLGSASDEQAYYTDACPQISVFIYSGTTSPPACACYSHAHTASTRCSAPATCIIPCACVWVIVNAPVLPLQR